MHTLINEVLYLKDKSLLMSEDMEHLQMQYLQSEVYTSLLRGFLVACQAACMCVFAYFLTGVQ